MAIEKTIDINVNSSDAIKDITLLNSVLEEQEQITIELLREQQKLEQQLRDTPKNSLAAQKKLTTQLNHVKDSVKDQNLSVKELKVQQKSLGSSSKDLTNDLVSNGGAMGILNNLTGGLAQQFKDSYEAISLSSKGLSGFKKAMVATGIGALVVLVGALVANWDKVKDALSGASEESKAYKEAQDDIVSAVTKVQKSITKMDNIFEQAKKGTISKDEALKQYNESLGESVGYATSLSQAESLLVSNASIVIESTKLKAQAEVLYAKAAEARAKVIAGDESLDPNFWQTIKVGIAGVGGATKAAQKYGLEYANNVNESLNTAIKLEDSAAELQVKISKLEEGLKKGSTNPKIIRSRNKEIKNLEDEKAKLDEERIKELDELKSKIRDAEANTEDEARKLQLTKIREHNEKLLKEAEAAKLKTQELEDSLNEKVIAKQAEFDRIDEERRKKKDAEDAADKLKEQQKIISELELKKELEGLTFQEQRDLIKERQALLLEDKTLTTEQSLALESQFSEAKIEIGKKEIELEAQKTAAKQKAVDDAISLAGAESEIGKALLILKQGLALKEMIMEAKKTITFASIASAKSTVAVAEGSAQTAKVGFPQNIPLLIGYAAQAAGIISAISSATGKAKSAASSLGGGGGSISTPSAPSAPPAFNIVGASGSSQLADAIGGQSQQPIQTYVVANDVTTAQSLQNNIVEGATIG